MPWLYNIVELFVRLLFFLFTRCQVIGKENIPNRGALLIVANHIELPDVPLLAVSLNRRLSFMAKEELFQRRFLFLGYLIRKFGSFPVHRGRLDRKALRQAEKVLADGLVLVMFPEGTRSRSGRLRHAFLGSALIALRSGAPILPVGITGTEKIKGVGWIVTRPRMTVNIGAPFRLPSVNSELTRAELAEYTEIIMRRIAALLPVEYRGDHAPRRD